MPDVLCPDCKRYHHVRMEPSKTPPVQQCWWCYKKEVLQIAAWENEGGNAPLHEEDLE